MFCQNTSGIGFNPWNIHAFWDICVFEKVITSVWNCNESLYNSRLSLILHVFRDVYSHFRYFVLNLRKCTTVIQTVLWKLAWLTSPLCPPLLPSIRYTILWCKAGVSLILILYSQDQTSSSSIWARLESLPQPADQSTVLLKQVTTTIWIQNALPLLPWWLPEQILTNKSWIVTNLAERLLVQVTTDRLPVKVTLVTADLIHSLRRVGSR